MPLPYVVQFVDRITATPTVRLDIAATWAIQRDSDLSPPVLDRAFAGSLLADGRPVTAAAYGNRTVTLVLKLRDDGATEDQAAAAVQALARELDRSANILRWQPGTSQPVFFRTLRADFGALQWDAFTKRCVVQIPAEPFGYGLKVTLSPATVNNDPAAASNALGFDIAGATILGDVETPLFLKVTSSASLVAAGRVTSALAIRRTGTPSVVPYVWQIEGSSFDPDTTLQANSAAMSGAGQNYTRTTFAVAPSSVTRASWGAWPVTASTDMRGTYRAFLRCRKNGTGTVFVNLVITNSSLSVVVAGDTEIPDTVLRWRDLGLVQIPAGADPVADGYSGVPLTVGGMSWLISASRVTGSATLDLDAFVLVPADDRFALIKWPSATVATEFIIDSAASRVYALGSSGQVLAVQPVEIAGGLPMVTPGQAARVVWMLDAGSTSNAGDSVTATTVITPHYWPRYLYVRGAS